MLESYIQATTRARCLSELGVRSIKLSSTTDSGWPDVLFFIPGGRPLFIEFKQPGEGLAPRQVLVKQFMEYNNYDRATHSNIEEAVKAVASHVERARAASSWPKALGTVGLPKEGHKVPAGKGRSRVIFRPRDGQD